MSSASQRIVLTGAAGKLGSLLRPMLRSLCPELLLTDIGALPQPPQSNERFVPCDLADSATLGALLQGAAVVVHMGGVSHEAPFAAIQQANLQGCFNVYDRALAAGVPRIVLASSNHVTGFYEVQTLVDADMPVRPDSLYGVSKCYAEALARYYHDRHGIQSVCLRIGSCSEYPASLRALSAWISPRDMISLVRCAIQTPQPGFALVWGVSANAARWWGKDDAARIGYQPLDHAEAHCARLLAARPRGASHLQGGEATLRDYRDPASLL